MKNETSSARTPFKRSTAAAVAIALRDARAMLAQLNRRVRDRLGLRDVELDCLDIVSRLGPQTPGGLAQLASLHPATMTGVLDRLERDGWVSRERDGSDRRAVIVRLDRSRSARIVKMYDGMQHAIDRICSEYGDAELTMIAGFLKSVGDAARNEADSLAAS